MSFGTSKLYLSFFSTIRALRQKQFSQIVIGHVWFKSDFEVFIHGIQQTKCIESGREIEMRIFLRRKYEVCMNTLREICKQWDTW